MEHVKGGGVTLPDFEGMDKQAIIFAKDLQDDLGGVVNAVGGMKRVRVFLQSEIGNGVQLVEVWANDAEEVPSIRSLNQSAAKSDKQSKM